MRSWFRLADKVADLVPRFHEADILASLISFYLAVSAAVLGLLMGLPDALLSDTFGARVRGAVFFALAIAAAVGSAAVLFFRGSAPRPRAGALAIWGATAAGLGWAYLLIDVLFDETYLPFALGYGILLALDLGALLMLAQAGATFPLPRQIGVAAIAVALASIVNFWYSQLYQPSAEIANVSLSASVGDAVTSADHKSAAIPVTFTISNDGKVNVYIVNSQYSVIGRSTKLMPPSPASEVSERNRALDKQLPYSRDSTTTGYSLLQADEQIAAVGQMLGAGQSVTEIVSVKIRLPADFDTIGANSEVAYVRADRVNLAQSLNSARSSSWDFATGKHVSNAPIWVSPTEQVAADYVYRTSGLSFTSRIDKLTHRPTKIATWWVVGNPSSYNPLGTYLVTAFCRASCDDPGPPTDSQKLGWYRHFGFEDYISGLSERSAAEIHLTVAKGK